jgi:glycosyltransferase involved in cell wall biosynthesis
VTEADVVLAGNSFLALRAEEHGARSTKVHYMPTCINLAAYEKAAGEAEPRPGDDRLVMVWIGSSSTLKGLEATQTLWERIGQAVPNAVLRVVCDRFPKFRHLAVEPVAWSQAGEIPAIVSADIGISHVPDDLWSRGKCGLKVLQYLAGGLPVLTNPVGVHPEMVTPGLTGFLLDHPREWLEAIEWLGRNLDRTRAMGREAVEVIRRGYDVADWAIFFADRVAPGSVPIQTQPEMQSTCREWLMDKAQAPAPAAHAAVTQRNKAERGVAL